MHNAAAKVVPLCLALHFTVTLAFVAPSLPVPRVAGRLVTPSMAAASPPAGQPGGPRTVWDKIDESLQVLLPNFAKSRQQQEEQLRAMEREAEENRLWMQDLRRQVRIRQRRRALEAQMSNLLKIGGSSMTPRSEEEVCRIAGELEGLEDVDRPAEDSRLAGCWQLRYSGHLKGGRRQGPGWLVRTLLLKHLSSSEEIEPATSSVRDVVRVQTKLLPLRFDLVLDGRFRPNVEGSGMSVRFGRSALKPLDRLLLCCAPWEFCPSRRSRHQGEAAEWEGEGEEGEERGGVETGLGVSYVSDNFRLGHDRDGALFVFQRQRAPVAAAAAAPAAAPAAV